MSQKIPLRILRPAAEALIPGPSPTASQVKHGAKSKLKLLRELVGSSKEWRKKVREWDAERTLAGANADLAARGYRGESAIAPDADLEAIQKWRELWTAVEQSQIARTGKSTLTRALSGEETQSLLALQLAGRMPIPHDGDAAALLADIRGVSE